MRVLSDDYTPPPRAADDFAAIARRLKEIEAEKRKEAPVEEYVLW